MSIPADSSEGGRILSLETAQPFYLDSLRLGGRSEATLRARANALRHFARFWGARDLREAAPEDLERYAGEATQVLARESAFQYLATLRAFFRSLVDRGQLLVNPARALVLPRMHSRTIGRTLSQGEMARLLESPSIATPEGLRDRALLEFLYSTGLRASEARRLGVEDVGEDAISVRAGKGARDRRTPLGARARRWIDRYLNEARPGLAKPETAELWVTGRGRAFGEAWFARHLGGLGRTAGIQGVTCHAIRRSMATHLLSAGAAAAEVSGILGHADLGSLARYAQAVDRDLRKTHRETHPRERP